MRGQKKSMRKMTYAIVASLFLFPVLANIVWAQDETFGDKFLGNPLLVLLALLIVSLVSVVVRMIRK